LCIKSGNRCVGFVQGGKRIGMLPIGSNASFLESFSGIRMRLDDTPGSYGSREEECNNSSPFSLLSTLS